MDSPGNKIIFGLFSETLIFGAKVIKDFRTDTDLSKKAQTVRKSFAVK